MLNIAPYRENVNTFFEKNSKNFCRLHIVSGYAQTTYMFDFLSSFFPKPASSSSPADAVRKLFSESDDLEERKIFIKSRGSYITVLWLDGCVSSAEVAEDILRPLPQLSDAVRSLRDEILSGGVYGASVKPEGDPDAIAQAMAAGCAALFPEGSRDALLFDVKSSARRSVDTPQVEKSVLGAKDAFTETLHTNTALLRRRIRSPQLKLREFAPCRGEGVKAALLYTDACPERVRSALEDILAHASADTLLSLGDLERLVVPAPRSVFPQVLHTERPDRFAEGLLRGRAGLLLDGIPVGILLPGTLPESMNVAEDRARHGTVAAFLTHLRYGALLLSLLLPALYVSVAVFHQEMLPFKLLLSVIAAKQQVPFSTSVEVLGMLLSFELLQEAGVRLPDTVGQTVSIIGALIVGQSAVEARVISPIAVIVVAMAGICGYTQPSQEVGSAVRLWRLFLVLWASVLGMVGVMSGFLLLLWRLCSTECFGTAYLYPLCDGRRGDRRRIFFERNGTV